MSSFSDDDPIPGRLYCNDRFDCRELLLVVNKRLGKYFDARGSFDYVQPLPVVLAGKNGWKRLA